MSKLNEKVDRYWNGHFYIPLERVQEAAHKLGLHPVDTEVGLWRARVFARRLWECCDDYEMEMLVQDDPEGAAKFSSFGAQVAVDLLHRNPGPNPLLDPKPGKPFIGVAGFILWMFDMMEKKTPERFQQLK